jgi:hypothetical protein
MSSNFRQEYAALTDFIVHHPEIEIGESVVSIPGEVRSEFYDLFNAVRDAFVDEKFPAYLSEAALLSEQHCKAVEGVSNLFFLEDEPAVVSGVQRFLLDPKGELTRELFDPLFDLLKGRESIDGFEKKASYLLEGLFPPVFRGGYEKWAILSLVALLEVDNAFRVDARNLGSAVRANLVKHATMDEVPLPTESISFLFSQPRNVIFAVPDLIVHSSRLNRFVGIRSEFGEGIFKAWNPSPRREWQPINTDLLILLECGLTLIYAAEQAEDIALVADATCICRPDLILWCVDTGSMSREEALEKMTHANSLFQPAKGSYIIANHPWPEPSESADIDQQAPITGIQILSVGYDQSNLMPVVEALANPDSTTLPVPNIE